MVFEEDGGVVWLVMEEVELGRSLGESSPATRVGGGWPELGLVRCGGHQGRGRRGSKEK